jgi:hypothetical protein
MKFSALQKFIVKKCFIQPKKILQRAVILDFYLGDSPAKESSRQKNITQSLERLIDRELLTGFGKRTPHKWFITGIKLTPKGLKIAKKIQGEQLKLKLK